MKVLVVGSGGREHTIVWKLSQSPRVDRIYAAPGNAGTALLAENVGIKGTDITGLLEFARNNEIDLTVVGPEAPLVDGIVDIFTREGLKIFGPGREAARLEGSKVFAKDLMKKYGIPTGEYEVFSEPGEAIDYIKGKGTPIVIKAEGLAAGKGVTVARTEKEAVEAVREILINKSFGSTAGRVVIEEYLEGEEATILAFVDGKTVIPMLPSQDHKQVYDGDQGPNTGGMGAYAPAPVVNQVLMDRVFSKIMLPTVEALRKEGIIYRGILYCGLMIKEGEPKVLEYNVRFGDPETQVVLPLLETDLLEIIEAVLEERLDRQEVEWKSEKAVCVVMASGGYPVEYETGREITGIEEAEEDEEIKVFQAGTARKGEALLTAGGRVLGITALGNEFSRTIDRAYLAVDKIDFDAAHYRKDIGQRAITL